MKPRGSKNYHEAKTFENNNPIKEKEESSDTVRSIKSLNPKSSGQSEAESIRVIICDSCATIRYGLQGIFSSAPGIDVIMQAYSQAEVLGKSDGLNIDVIQLDIDDDKQTGLENLKQLREKMPNAKTMVFTNCRDNKRIIEAVELGIEGFQYKQDAEADTIISAVRKLHKGGKALAPCVTEALLSHRQSKQQKAQAHLSVREQEVLDLIATGKSNSDIADKLYISVRTVKFHVSSILTKLNAKNRTQAALWLL